MRTRWPVVDQPFKRGDLYRIRSTVAVHAAGAGIVQVQIDWLVLIASELAVNVMAHAGGAGWLRMWCFMGDVFLQVADEGGGIDDADDIGRVKPPPGQPGGRGLWAVRTLSDELVIDTSPRGTTVTARLTIQSASSGRA